MALTFPNQSRSYDEANKQIRFSGHDGMFEVRFFVDGEGLFWFNLDNGTDPVFCLICEKGDLISVPAGTKHWFDFGPRQFVKCIRVFIEVSGWTPHYTQSGLDAPYNALGLSAN